MLIPEMAGDEWRAADTHSFAIGQSTLSATPLQIARVTAAIATGGRLVTPHLIERLVARGGAVRRGFLRFVLTALIFQGLGIKKTPLAENVTLAFGERKCFTWLHPHENSRCKARQGKPGSHRSVCHSFRILNAWRAALIFSASP